MSDNQEILKRLRELEEENARLKQNQEIKSGVSVVEGNYKGRPILTFYGTFKPFTLGIKKLKAIKESWAEIEEFLKRHKEDDESDVKI